MVAVVAGADGDVIGEVAGTVVRAGDAFTLVVGLLLDSPASTRDHLYQDDNESSYPEHERGGIILTGSMETTDELKCLIDGCQVPILCSQADTFRVSSQMASLEFKIRSFDTEKISKLHTLTNDNVDISYILNKLE